MVPKDDMCDNKETPQQRLSQFVLNTMVFLHHINVINAVKLLHDKQTLKEAINTWD